MIILSCKFIRAVLIEFYFSKYILSYFGREACYVLFGWILVHYSVFSYTPSKRAENFLKFGTRFYMQ